MLKTKKILSLLLALILITTALVGCGNDAKETLYQDGIYQGSAQGHNAEVEVEVTVKDGKIAEIEVLQHHETKVLTDPVFEKAIPAIISENSVNIDTFTGATITSLALKNAIKDALTKAGGNEDVFKKGKLLKFDSASDSSEETYDVVVIGAGGAGLIAAIEAKAHGANVVILEKMPFVGGNTLVSGGEFNAPNTWVQEKLGIEDSVEQYYTDTLKAGDFEGDEELIRTLAENITEGGEWLRDSVNVEFIEDYLMHFGGHSVPRAIYPIGGSGVELIQKLGAHAEAKDIPIKLSMKAEKILTDDNDRVVGVEATDVTGRTVTFHAEKAVIIATGGFGANYELTKKYNSEIDERYKGTIQKGTMGDGILMAEEIGADLMGMEHIQTYPTCNPLTGNLSYVADTRFDGAVLVNKEGQRFVEEMERRDVISKGILAQTDSIAYLVWDKTIKENSHMDKYQVEFDNMEKQNLIIKADTLEEAAAFFDIDEKQLLETIKTYNGYVQEGQDKDFNRRGKLVALTEGPYYIQKVAPAIHHTMGGIKINSEARVIDKDGNPIEGLFAAGEVTGGIHGTNRLGGNAISDLIVFGRIAGQTAAK
ncbi:flavocytochrome c [Natronincola ferrireducens]|uniref:Urocanate reductase n=1 Tax=Natronincola ferrireducens TaxID=393762 RepID=A0A1G8Y7E2_9FIRM|nr:flavocytochrome c [Natronincola ferrireducens]SDJ98726.1 urocanate reductase [Natronincola ferrireducens]